MMQYPNWTPLLSYAHVFQSLVSYLSPIVITTPYPLTRQTKAESRNIPGGRLNASMYTYDHSVPLVV